jgi:hypothetical protein
MTTQEITILKGRNRGSGQMMRQHPQLIRVAQVLQNWLLFHTHQLPFCYNGYLKVFYYHHSSNNDQFE